VAKLHLRKPQQYCDAALYEKNADDPHFWERYKRAVVFFRTMMIVQIVAVSKINIDLVKHNDDHLMELMALKEEQSRPPAASAGSTTNSMRAPGKKRGDEEQGTPRTPRGSVRMPRGSVRTNNPLLYEVQQDDGNMEME
jgi:hypothetical protein